MGSGILALVDHKTDRDPLPTGGGVSTLGMTDHTNAIADAFGKAMFDLAATLEEVALRGHVLTNG